MTTDDTMLDPMIGPEPRLYAALRLDPPAHLRDAMDERFARVLTTTGRAHPRVTWRDRVRARPRGLVLGLGLLLAVGCTTAGTALVLEHGSREQDQRSPVQYNAEVSAALEVTPFPPGYHIPVLTAPVHQDVIRGAGAGTATVQRAAMCAWTHAWLAAHAAGDTHALGAATAVMSGFPDWMAVADPRHADPAIRERTVALADAAHAGEPMLLQEEAALCLDVWPWP